VRCRNCGLVFRRWAWNKMYKASEERTADSPMDYPVRLDEKRRATFSRIIEVIEPFRDNNRVLDVGSGEGYFLKLCSEKKWNVFGVEANSKLAELCKNLNGVDVIKVRFEEANFPENFFDVVTFMNVLEHMEDPFLALKKAHRIIRPGGAILIRFPNGALHVRGRKVACIIYRMFKSVRRFDFFTISSYAFNGKSILTYLNRADFVGCKVSNDNSWGLQQVGDKVIFEKLCKNLALKMIEWLDKFSQSAWLMAPSLLVRGTKRRV
jgi:2-polyprenyl-3-methyl-5-hydroxy-6-metoxy-1,4-benzoquinol methylase